jgi:tetratricopeptide (TPR) repeat protein
MQLPTVTTMNTDHELDENGLSALEKEFGDELVQIMLGSENDLEGAIAALDHYLAQAPPRELESQILFWKGLFYVEHQRYDDAVRVLRIATGLLVSGDLDLRIFNIKCALAMALEHVGEAQQAYVVLTAALDEMESPSLMLHVLAALVPLSSRLGQPMPPRSEEALPLVKQYYGFDHPPEPDLPSEVARLNELVQSSEDFSHLHWTVRKTEGLAKKIGMVEAYLDHVIVPLYKREAEELLQELREGKQ